MEGELIVQIIDCCVPYPKPPHVFFVPAFQSERLGDLLLKICLRRCYELGSFWLEVSPRDKRRTGISFANLDEATTLRELKVDKLEARLVMTAREGCENMFLVGEVRGGWETEEELLVSFWEASRRGFKRLVTILLERGVDPSANVNAAVRVAGEKRKYASPLPGIDWIEDTSDRTGHACVLEILLADERVDGTCAIPTAHPSLVQILLEDSRCGISVNRDLFERYHRDKVARYDERTEQICAASWCMKQIGEGWGDLREPTEERMQKLPLGGEMRSYPKDWEAFPLF